MVVDQEALARVTSISATVAGEVPSDKQFDQVVVGMTADGAGATDACTSMGAVGAGGIAGEAGVHRLSDVSGGLGAFCDIEGEYFCCLIFQLTLLLDDL